MGTRHLRGGAHRTDPRVTELMTALTTALHVPATATLLDAWEGALAAEPAHRALHVLEAMCDENDRDLGDRSPGELNRLLLQARVLLFGGACDAIADCPCCGAALEATIPLETWTSAAPPSRPVRETTVGDLRVTYRVPTCSDLAGLTHQPIDDAAEQLLARCVTSIRAGERDLALSELAAEAVRGIDEVISGTGADALINVKLVCPECGDTVGLQMDPASFLWDELDRWALSVLCEVAELASVFGWSEQTILSMSPWRRRTYLAIAQPGRRS